jgi:hypothetical protein
MAQSSQRFEPPQNPGRFILHELGWKDIQTTYGFRKSASTLLNEMEWKARLVDMQMSCNLKGRD